MATTERTPDEYLAYAEGRVAWRNGDRCRFIEGGFLERAWNEGWDDAEEANQIIQAAP